MKFENEITVKVNMSYEELISHLLKKRFKEIDNYTVDDLYLVNSTCDLYTNSLEILKNCVIVRTIDNYKHYLTYKYKEYDQNENIIKQGKVKTEICNKLDGIEFLKAIGYKELIKVFDYINVYEKDGLEINIERVNDKYLFIEIEENDKYIGLDKLIEGLDSTGIEYDKSNYFVKKAKIILEEK